MAAGRRSVTWTESARSALDDVIAYIVEDSREAATRVLVRALDAAASLDLLRRARPHHSRDESRGFARTLRLRLSTPLPSVSGRGRRRCVSPQSARLRQLARGAASAWGRRSNLAWGVSICLRPGPRAWSEGSYMRNNAFDELLTSVRQAGRIRRGTLKSSRVATFRPADGRPRKARDVPERVRTHDRRQRGDAPKLRAGPPDARRAGVGASPRGRQKSKGGNRSVAL